MPVLSALPAEELLAAFESALSRPPPPRCGLREWEATGVLRAELLRRLRVAEAFHLLLDNLPPDPPADPE